MALVRPFHALRPAPEAAFAVAAVPYDVVSTAEARALAADNPLSFLHVSRAEIDLAPDVDPHSDVVYETARRNFAQLKERAPLVKERSSSLYCYRLEDGAHRQTGFAGCFALDEYDRQIIRKHEVTRRDKEDDRTRHMLALDAQTGIVFLTFRATSDLEAISRRVQESAPLLDFTASDEIRHSIWRLGDADQAATEQAFADVPVLYIADGHHRMASAARARDQRAADAADEASFVLGVAFPDAETQILPYHRAVADLGEHDAAGLLNAVNTRFPVTRVGTSTSVKGQLGMYLDGAWYRIDLSVAAGPSSGRRVDRLDVAVLQHQLLDPVLGVKDVRSDPRMTFVGGVRGTAALAELVDTGQAAVAFTLAAVTPEELLAVSDAGDIMPPKSTWFEPKLRDGLLIHEI